VGAIAAGLILNSQLGRLHGARFVVSGVGLMTYEIVVLHALVENDLVDELHLMIFPVVLGTGKRVFGETSDKKRFRLAESMMVGDGVAVMIYERPVDSG
jgi:RibD C-terminal domain